MLMGDVVEEDRSPTFLLGMGGLAEADSIPAGLMCAHRLSAAPLI